MNRKASLRGISSGLGRLTTKWLKKKKKDLGWRIGSRVKSVFKYLNVSPVILLDFWTSGFLIYKGTKYKRKPLYRYFGSIK